MPFFGWERKEEKKGVGGLLKGEANQMIKYWNEHGVVQKAMVQKLIKNRVLSKVWDQFVVHTGPDWDESRCCAVSNWIRKMPS